MQEFDTVVIGAGPGGYHVAAALAAKGERVAVIERAQPGGTCLNRGCIPTKCLAASADALRECRRAGDFGVDCQVGGFDYGRARTRMLGIVDGLRQGVAGLLRGVTYIEGEARICPGMEVRTDGGEVCRAAARIVIATGSRPAPLRADGAALAVDSTAALELDRLPGSAVIIGGGVIGMELASIWQTMGVQVTVLEYCREILPGIDAEVAKRLRSAMSRQGVTVITGAEVTAVRPGYVVEYTTKKGSARAEGALVVASVGRRAVVPEGAVECGIALDSRGFIAVDSHMRTSVAGIYAVGDVNGLSMLAHSASAQAAVVAEDDPGYFDSRAVPAVVFTHPEVAQVGTVPEGADVISVKRIFGANGKALAMGQGEGFVKLTCRRDDSAVIAAAVIGPHASDLIAEATVLVADRVPYGRISRRFIHAHPTLSEIFI